MRNKLYKSMALISIIVIPILLSCASTSQAPDEARLRLRFQDVHTAMGAKDAKTWYEISTPYGREKTLEEFKKAKKIDEKSIQVRMDAKLEKVCICAPIRDQWGERLRCVFLVFITEHKPEGLQGRLLEMWEYFDREWYFGGIAPTMDYVDDCPPYR